MPLKYKTLFQYLYIQLCYFSHVLLFDYILSIDNHFLHTMGFNTASVSADASAANSSVMRNLRITHYPLSCYVLCVCAKMQYTAMILCFEYHLTDNSNAFPHCACVRCHAQLINITCPPVLGSNRSHRHSRQSNSYKKTTDGFEVVSRVSAKIG